MNRNRILALLSLASLPFVVIRLDAQDRPRLVVVISIDQFRPDLLARLRDHLLPASSDGRVGGFRYLMETGSSFADARYEHFPLETGPGHAVILTGANPSRTGIVANDWWDPTTSSARYCVGDSAQRVVGARPMSRARPMGPRNLRVTTLGDELEIATGGAARTVSIAVKDRASILLAGHAADVAVWFDETAGNWISSTAYCRDGNLPAWIEEFNRAEIVERSLGRQWRSDLPATLLAIATPRREPAYPEWGMGESFPHKIGAERNATSYRAFRLTPDANRYTLETARRAVIAEKLGADDVPDLLTIGLSANDYAGHAFGINSPEVFDVTVQTDSALAAFFGFLATALPRGLDDVVIALTADHGASAIPESAAALGIPAGRIFRRDVMVAARTSLVRSFGDARWLATRRAVFDLDSVDADIAEGGYIDPYLYLDEGSIATALRNGRASSRAQIEETAAAGIEAIVGIHSCYTRSQIENGMLSGASLSRHVANAFHPRVSGDVLVITEPSYVMLDRPQQYTSSHGTPFAYDAHVPLMIAGKGIARGAHLRRVTPADLAPTLALLLGIEFPSGCEGEVLREAMGAR
jgi:hypothetical protein